MDFRIVFIIILLIFAYKKTRKNHQLSSSFYASKGLEKMEIQIFFGTGLENWLNYYTIHVLYIPGKYIVQNQTKIDQF